MHLSNFVFFSCLLLQSLEIFLSSFEFLLSIFERKGIKRTLSLRVFLVLSFQNRKVRYEMVSCQSFEVIVLGWPENGLQITLKVTNFLNFQVYHVMRCKIIFSLGCLTSKFI
jgi:hypothetical protein